LLLLPNIRWRCILRGSRLHLVSAIRLSRCIVSLKTCLHAPELRHLLLLKVRLLLLLPTLLLRHRIELLLLRVRILLVTAGHIR
jgi:hypothetical protein